MNKNLIYTETTTNLSSREKEEIENCEFEICDISKFLKYVQCKVKYEAEQIQPCSDGGNVNVDCPKSILISLILHLSDKESSEIMKKHNAVKRLKRTAENFLRASIGSTTKIEKSLSDIEALSSERRAELLEYFGKMFTVKEIFRILKGRWKNVRFTKEDIAKFQTDNWVKIQELVKQHQSDVTDLRLVHKKSRLEELVYAYAKAKEKWHSTDFREDGKFMLAIMAEIRKEAEGERISIEGNFNVKVQQDVNIQIRNEIFKNMNIKEILLGRLASKMGISSSELIKDLRDSHYAKYTSLIGDGGLDVLEEIPLPSLQPYDFNMIRLKQEEKRKQEEDNIIVLKQEETSGESKNKLLELLKRNADRLAKNKNEIR